MDNIFGELEASVQAKIEADVDFQSELEVLDDEEKIARIGEKKTELFNQELAEFKKAKELADNYKVRAEKAEKQLKNPPKEKETPKNDMSLKDIRALNNVHDDDVDEVIDYAKYKGITPAEALKTPAMIAVLKAKEEERRTAQATNTGTGKRGISAKTDEQVISEFEKGNISEDYSDIERLAEARNAMRKARKI